MNFAVASASARRMANERPLERGSLLLAPVIVTPTKALTPSHVKGLIWLDLLFKATRQLRPTHYSNNRRTFDITQQTSGFWAYLDREYPGCTFADKSERWIGERYLDFHRAAAEEHAVTGAYRVRIERDGFVHPASERVLELWAGYYQTLGLWDPGLRASRELSLGAEDALALLQQMDCLLDLRPLGGGAFADLTQDGIALRQLVDPHGDDNYMLCALRELLPQARRFDQVLLLSDEELTADYIVLERLLARAGSRAARLSLGRVALATGAKQSRDGGWHDYTLDLLIDSYVPKFGQDAFRLGMRLYFIAELGRGGSKTFAFEELERVLARAARLLEKLSPVDEPRALERSLRRCTSPQGYVDPYRLASLLFAKRVEPELAALLPLFLG